MEHNRPLKYKIDERLINLGCFSRLAGVTKHQITQSNDYKDYNSAPIKNSAHLVLSVILSNSSMQHTPLSDKTRAPGCIISCLLSGSLTTYAVRPTALEPYDNIRQ